MNPMEGDRPVQNPPDAAKRAGTARTGNDEPDSAKRILIVDDSRTNVTLLEKSLRHCGYEIISALNGLQAIKVLAAAFEEGNPPDLVLLDVMMPGMDGFETCRRLKEMAARQEYFIPIVLLTSLDSVEDKVAGFESGAEDYLVKPPDRQELLARVRSMIRIKDLQDGLMKANRELETTQNQLQREFQVVGDLQLSFLPKVYPSHPELSLAAVYEPSEMAGGDYYDVIKIDEEHWGLVVADVTGHGASAAVVMAVTHLLMHSFVNTFHFPSTALKVVNEKLNAHLTSDHHFVTMFYGILCLKPKSAERNEMMFTYASAGHNPMYIVRSRTGEVEELHTKMGFPLRSFESDEYDEARVDLQPGDKLVLFTDGLIENCDDRGKILGEAPITKALREMREKGAEETANGLYQLLADHCGDTPFRDDITVFVLHRAP